MRKIVLFIVSLPFLLACLCLTVLTIPIAIIAIPAFLFVALIAWIKECFDIDALIKTWACIALVGIWVYFDLVWDWDFWE